MSKLGVQSLLIILVCTLFAGVSLAMVEYGETIVALDSNESNERHKVSVGYEGSPTTELSAKSVRVGSEAVVIHSGFTIRVFPWDKITQIRLSVTDWEDIVRDASWTMECPAPLSHRDRPLRYSTDGYSHSIVHGVKAFRIPDFLVLVIYGFEETPELAIVRYSSLDWMEFDESCV